MKLTSLIILIIFSGKLFSQNQTTTAGGTATGSGGTVTYTIGLPMYTNQNATGIIVTQGTQQPKEFFTTSYQSPKLNSGIRLYPNPVQSYFYIEIFSKQIEHLTFKLTTTDGKLLLEEKFTSQITMVNMNDYAEGMYLVQLFSENELMTSNKIIKINR